MSLDANLSVVLDMYIICMVKDLEDTSEKYQGKISGIFVCNHDEKYSGW